MFRLRGVSYRYDGTGGVDIDALDIPEQRITAVIGPSGSGKTTLLSILAGFLSPTISPGGAFTFDSRPAGLGCFAAGDVGFVFQAPMLLGAASASVNMLAGHSVRQRRGSTAIDAEELLNLVEELGLASCKGALLARRARQLSGGEAQRVSVLRALLTDPRVILCDEPTSHLDRSNAAQVMRALSNWSARKGRPVVWVTHALDQAADYADHYVFLRDGRLDAPPPETASLLASPDPAQRLRGLQAMERAEAERTRASAPMEKPSIELSHFQVRPARYSRWLARALATDGAIARRLERRRPQALVAPDHAAAMRALIDPVLGPGGTVRRLTARIGADARYTLGLSIMVLLMLVVGLQTGRVLSQTYVHERLTDPSISRIVFEYVPNALQATRAGQDPDPLTLTRLQMLEEEVEDEIGVDGLGLTILGRRPVTNSQVRIPDAPNSLCRDWVGVGAMALASDDPILRQTVFTDRTRRAVDIAAALRGEAEAAALDPVRPGVAVMARRLAETMAGACGVAADDPALRIEWASSDAMRNAGVALRIVAIADRMPPFHPYSADLIVFESDFQRVAQRADVEPEPFRTATAYIPLDRFAGTEAALAARGYVVRDDNRAAVEQLRFVQSLLGWLPDAITVLALVAVYVSLFQIVSTILELNKRVFALYSAIGFRMRDVMAIIGRYVAPTVLIPLGLIWAITCVAYLLLADSLSPELKSLLRGFWRAYLVSTLLILVMFVLMVLISTWNWWRASSRNLTENLKD